MHATATGSMRHDMAARRTVLVVDDEAGNVELMRDFLEVDGFTVLTANERHFAPLGVPLANPLKQLPEASA